MFGQLAYSEILRTLIEEGFLFCRFLEETSVESQKSICLRHDIDFSVSEALKMAMLEYDAGVKATYFFMCSSNTYNLFSKTNFNMIQEIRRLGHDISLHFDPTVYEDIDYGFRLEKDTFENFFKTKIGMVSIHRPGDFLKDNNRKFVGCRHTYEDDFIKKMVYISDSGGRNIFKKIFELSQLQGGVRLHVLIHPIWWINTSSDPTATLNIWLKTQHDFLVEETRRNCKTFQG